MDHVKASPHAPAGFFEAEAAGLRWLAAAGGAQIARVLDVRPGRIVLAQVTHAAPTAAAARTFGRDLARTHAAGAPAFGARPEGWDGPLFIGSRGMPALAHDSWGTFYSQARVRPFLAPALAAGFLRADEARLVERACALLEAGAFDDDTPPARIHGDLWAGNVLFSPDGVVLIDPAAHGGHPETDLAMLALFGLPHLDDALAGYDEAAPLRPGWRERVPLHQLHPLAVHAAGHGRAYGIALAEAADTVLRLA
ncbi:fructosamine kinase family protein [Demequina sp. SYSU T00192]|uniref:Fructosamine kinase family protein n=1 Tax=Demequina litoralis TaxID=3051660 RepID=A0ABT8GBX7_9MICO|nr:fructosamine kinase family protein [Demequina sp. SYSU T00192]MDN4476562.1 fructosamine kinase family protein [Demequina sp. SYSU T00192]